MSLSPEELKYIQQNLTTVFCIMSTTALLAYDALLNLDREITSVWNRKLSGTNCLYVLIRFGTLVKMFFALISLFGPQIYSVYVLYSVVLRNIVSVDCWISTYRCKATEVVLVILVVITVLSYSVFSVLRVWAIWGQHWLPVIIVLPFALVAPCINIYYYRYMVLEGISDLPLPYGGCIWGLSLDSRVILIGVFVGITSRASVIATDALVLFLTWVKTFGIKKAADQAKTQAKLTTLIMRDGTLYFGVHLALNLVAIILDHVVNTAATSVNYFIDGFSSILVAHFILNLRTFDNNTTNPNKSLHYSDIHFSRSITGNMSAPLQSFFDVTAGEQLQVDVSVQQQVEDPLAVGVLEEIDIVS